METCIVHKMEYPNFKAYTWSINVLQNAFKVSHNKCIEKIQLYILNCKDDIKYQFMKLAFLILLKVLKNKKKDTTE